MNLLPPNSIKMDKYMKLAAKFAARPPPIPQIYCIIYSVYIYLQPLPPFSLTSPPPPPPTPRRIPLFRG